MAHTAAEAIEAHEQQIHRCKGIFVSWAMFWRLIAAGIVATLIQLGAIYAWADAKACQVNDKQDIDIRNLQLQMAEIVGMKDDLRQMLVTQKQVNGQLLDLMVRIRK